VSSDRLIPLFLFDYAPLVEPQIDR
jgi:hypothetical protein